MVRYIATKKEKKSGTKKGTIETCTSFFSSSLLLANASRETVLYFILLSWNFHTLGKRKIA